MKPTEPNHQLSQDPIQKFLEQQFPILQSMMPDNLHIPEGLREELEQAVQDGITTPGAYLGFNDATYNSLEDIALGQYEIRAFRQALDVFLVLLSLDGTRGNFWRGAAACLQQMGHLADAANLYRMALVIDGKDAVSLLYLGETLLQMDQVEKGLMALEDGLALAKQDHKLQSYAKRAQAIIDRQHMGIKPVMPKTKAEPSSQTSKTNAQGIAPNPQKKATSPSPSASNPPAPQRSKHPGANQTPGPQASPATTTFHMPSEQLTSPLQTEQPQNARQQLEVSPALLADLDAVDKPEVKQAILTLFQRIQQGTYSIKALAGFTDEQMDALYRIACQQARSNQIYTAMDTCSWLLYLDENNGRYYQLMGLCLHHLRAHCVAQYFYKVALLCNPKDGQTALYLAEICAKLGEYTDAEQYLRQALELGPATAHNQEIQLRAQPLRLILNKQRHVQGQQTQAMPALAVAPSAKPSYTARSTK